MKFLGKQSCVGIGCVAAGFLAGTVGKLILTSKDAKKYIHTAQLQFYAARILLWRPQQL